MPLLMCSIFITPYPQNVVILLFKLLPANTPEIVSNIINKNLHYFSINFLLNF